MSNKVFYLFGWWTRTGFKAFYYSVNCVALVSLFFILLLSNFPGEEQLSNWRYLATEITLMTGEEWSQAYSSIASFLFGVFTVTAFCTVAYRCLKSDLVNNFLTNKIEKPINSFIQTKVNEPVDKWIESRSPTFKKILFYVPWSLLLCPIALLSQLNLNDINSKKNFPPVTKNAFNERISNEVIVRLPNGELIKGSASYSMDGNVLNLKFIDKESASESSLKSLSKE